MRTVTVSAYRIKVLVSPNARNFPEIDHKKECNALNFRFPDIDLTPGSSLEASGRVANERRRRNAQSRILAAVADLEAAKERVSVRAIRRKTGSGSYTTISRVLRERAKNT
jgi:hypothetical protein